jgi:phage tail sheath gpL-like
MFMPTPNISVVPAPMSSVSSSQSEDPVPPEIHAVIELYANQLAKVAFPEIDAGSLRRQADELRTEATAVARAREALDAALAGFAARQATLTETAARAVAYAQIYCAAHPDHHALASALAAVCAPRPATQLGPPRHRRRGRPPKPSAQLFDAPAAANLTTPG